MNQNVNNVHDEEKMCIVADKRHTNFKQRTDASANKMKDIPVWCGITHRAKQPKERTKDNFRIILANETQNRLTLFA